MKIDTDSTKEILQSDDGLFNRLQEENARLPPQVRYISFLIKMAKHTI
jgi:hypothetical protein